MEFTSDTKMDARVEKLRALLPAGCKVELSGFREAYDPHAPMVGSKHVHHAADHHGGVLTMCECGPPCCRPVDAPWNGGRLSVRDRLCNLPMADHKKSEILIITVKEECGEGEMGALLRVLKAEMELAEMKFEGFAFLGGRAVVDASLQASAAKEGS